MLTQYMMEKLEEVAFENAEEFWEGSWDAKGPTKNELARMFEHGFWIDGELFDWYEEVSGDDIGHGDDYDPVSAEILMRDFREEARAYFEDAFYDALEPLKKEG